MKAYGRIVVMAGVMGLIAATGAVQAADVATGDLLVLDNDKDYAKQGVFSYKYNAGTGQYQKSTEQFFIDLNAYANRSMLKLGRMVRPTMCVGGLACRQTRTLMTLSGQLQEN